MATRRWEGGPLNALERLHATSGPDIHIRIERQRCRANRIACCSTVQRHFYELRNISVSRGSRNILRFNKPVLQVKDPTQLREHTLLVSITTRLGLIFEQIELEGTTRRSRGHYTKRQKLYV